MWHKAPGPGAASVGKGPPPIVREMSENGAGRDWFAKAKLSSHKYLVNDW